MAPLLKVALALLLIVGAYGQCDRTPKTSWVHVPGGVQVHVLEVACPGRYTLLLLHGAFTDNNVWNDFMQKVDASHVIAPTLRGFGQTTLPNVPEDMSKENQTAIAVAALDQLGGNGELIIGVHSAANAILVHLIPFLAANRPDIYYRIKGLIFLSGTANYALKPATLNFLIAQYNTWSTATSVTPAQLDTLSFAVELYDPAALPGGYTISKDAELRMFTAVETGTVTSVQGAYLMPTVKYQEDYDAYLAAPQIRRIPKLGVVGQYDPYTTADLETFAIDQTNFSDILIYSLPNLWHYHFLQNSIDFANLVNAFIRSL